MTHKEKKHSRRRAMLWSLARMYEQRLERSVAEQFRIHGWESADIDACLSDVKMHFSEPSDADVQCLERFVAESDFETNLFQQGYPPGKDIPFERFFFTCVSNFIADRLCRSRSDPENCLCQPVSDEPTPAQAAMVQDSEASCKRNLFIYEALSKLSSEVYWPGNDDDRHAFKRCIERWPWKTAIRSLCMEMNENPFMRKMIHDNLDCLLRNIWNSIRATKTDNASTDTAMVALFGTLPSCR
jgi:hypothetical protein